MRGSAESLTIALSTIAVIAGRLPRRSYSVGPCAGCELAQLAMPVLAIGAEKAFGANVAVVMRNAATNVQELVVPNAGHWLMEEAPAATIAAVQDFIAAH